MDPITRAKPDDPNRCQHVIPQVGQCPNKKAGEGATNCAAHGGASQLNSAERLSLRNYRLTKYHARIQELGESSEVKSLRDEIGILRMLVEERLNRVNDSMDLLMQSQPISDLVIKIEKIVTSCHKMEERTSQCLDRQAILQFASEVINIIDSKLADKEVVESIADDILAAIGRISNVQEDNSNSNSH